MFLPQSTFSCAFYIYLEEHLDFFTASKKYATMKQLPNERKGFFCAYFSNRYLESDIIYRSL